MKKKKFIVSAISLTMRSKIISTIYKITNVRFMKFPFLFKKQKVAPNVMKKSIMRNIFKYPKNNFHDPLIKN